MGYIQSLTEERWPWGSCYAAMCVGNVTIDDGDVTIDNNDVTVGSFLLASCT